MVYTKTDPSLTSAGIGFTVRVDSVDRDCFISNEALAKLGEFNSTDINPMVTFMAFEATINGVARRLIQANVAGTPLLLGPNTFH